MWATVKPPPHFAQPGTLEFDFALRWRELALAHSAEAQKMAELHRQERELLRQEQREQFEHEKAKFHQVTRFRESVQFPFWYVYLPCDTCVLCECSRRDACVSSRTLRSRRET